MTDKLLTFNHVIGLTRISRASIYRLMAAGKFPQSIKITEKSVRWRASDITLWLDSLAKQAN